MLYVILFLMLLLLGGPYVIVTLLAHGSATLNANPVMTSLAPDDLPEDIVRHFIKPAEALSTNGFAPAAYFLIADYTPDTFTFVALWTNPQTSDVATVMVNLGGGRGVLARKQTLVYTDFYALFDNGFLIQTSNNPETPWLKPVPTRNVVQLRDVPSAAVVYRLHQSRASRLAPAGIGKFVPVKGEELSWYKQMLADGLRQQQAGGYLERGERTVLPPDSPHDICTLLVHDRELFVVHSDGEVVRKDRATLGTISRSRHCGAISAAALLPWVGGVRLLLATQEGPVCCVGLEDSVVTQYVSRHRGIKGLAASDGLVAAISADRQRIILWNSWDGRAPTSEVSVAVRTRHRVADITFAPAAVSPATPTAVNGQPSPA